MTRILAVLAMLAGISSPPAHAAGGQSTVKVDTLGPVQTGMPLPTFAGYDLNGNSLRWKHFIADAPEPNQGVVISVFASWCGPCHDRRSVAINPHRRRRLPRVWLWRELVRGGRNAPRLWRLATPVPRPDATAPHAARAQTACLAASHRG